MSVLSLLALTRKRLSGAQATMYTAPTWPTSVDMKRPVRPSQILTFLSNEALAMYRPSGEKDRWFTTCAAPRQQDRGMR